jgi:hypothetical protein
MQSLLLGTALTRAGATSTKSGTWLREMALRAMPGTSMMSKMAYAKHEAALKEIGLSDAQGKPTWFTDGKPDLMKMLDIGGAGAAKIPLERRAGLERQLFGAQGGGGFALLADPAVREQILNLRKTMDSPEFKNRYSSFTEDYGKQVTAQSARQTLQEFNNLLMDIGQHALPTLNTDLRDLKMIAEGISRVVNFKDHIPEGARKTLNDIGTAAKEGARAGAGIGSSLGPLGTAVGGVIGGVGGVASNYMANLQSKDKDKETTDFVRALKESSAMVPGGTPMAPRAAPTQQNLSFNIDGQTLAQIIINKVQDATRYDTSAPDANGTSMYGP